MNKVEIKKLISGTNVTLETFENMANSGGINSAIAFVNNIKGINATVGFLNKFDHIYDDESTGKSYRVTKMRFKLGIPRSQVAGSPLEKQCEGEWLLLTGVFQPNKKSEGYNIGHDFIRTREEENLVEQEKSDKVGKKPFIIYDWMKKNTNREEVTDPVN